MKQTLTENDMEAAVYEGLTELAYIPRRLAAQNLGITLRHVSNYVALLLEAVPDEFAYDKGSKVFDKEQYEALQKVRTLFKAGLLKEQIIIKLRKEGI